MLKLIYELNCIMFYQIRIFACLLVPPKLILTNSKLTYERGILKNSVLKAGNWPISKSELVNKNMKQLIRYINSVDLEKLNHSKSCK